MGQTHMLVSGAGAAVIAVATKADIQTAGCLVGGSLATAKLPDIDQRIPFIEHRGPLTHSPYMAVWFTILSMVALAFATGSVQLAGDIGLGLGLGVLLHQMADAMTISGVPLAFPIHSRDLHLLPEGMRIRTDGPMETVFGVLFAMAVVYYLWSHGLKV
jgi:membrane-bound metal-dependent hydrolase YbcI (DUF457 family)